MFDPAGPAPAPRPWTINLRLPPKAARRRHRSRRPRRFRIWLSPAPGVAPVNGASRDTLPASAGGSFLSDHRVREDTMGRMVKHPRMTTCSFCGRSSNVSGPHVEGPADVYLCERCSGIAADIFRHEREVREGRAETGTTQEGGPAWARCTFCGKPRGQTGPMVGGTGGTWICAACVDGAAVAVDEMRRAGIIPGRSN